MASLFQIWWVMYLFVRVGEVGGAGGAGEWDERDEREVGRGGQDCDNVQVSENSNTVQ